MNLSYKPLSDICEIIIGKTPFRGNSRYWGKGIKWVTISDMKDEYIYDTNEEITEQALKECGCKIIPPDTLLMSFKLSIGKLAFTGTSLCTNEAIVALPIKNKDEIDRKYLFYALSTLNLSDSADRAVKGKTLNKDKIKQLKIPIIPIKEQKNIVNKLDSINNLIIKRSRTIKILDELLQAIFYEMYGDPINNSKNKPLIEFQNTCSKIMGGGTPSKGKPEYYKGLIPWVTPKDMKNDYIYDSIDHITQDAISNCSAKLIPANSILMVIRSGILKRNLPIAINQVDVTINQDMKAFIVKANYEPLFILYYLKYYQNKLLSKVRSVTADNLNFDDVKKLPLFDCSYEEQKMFAHLAKIIGFQKKTQEKSMKEMEELFQSQLHNFFNKEN